MTVLLDFRRVPFRERADAVRDAISSFVPVDLDRPDRVSPTPTRGRIFDLGSMKIMSVNSDATVAERTIRQSRDDLEPSVVVALQYAGSSLVAQRDREVVLRPGGLVLFESDAPFTLIDREGIRQGKIRIPISRLALPRDVIRAVGATVLSPGHPVADLAEAFFRRLVSAPPPVETPGVETLELPSIELVRSLISVHLGAAGAANDSRGSYLRLAILEYVRVHLAEADLNATRIAAEHHISVRQLYKVLAEDDIRLSDWIRRERLNQCQRQLGRRHGQSMTVGEVARSWGFVDMSSFSRAFRAEFGMSPRQWRDLAGTASSAGIRR